MKLVKRLDLSAIKQNVTGESKKIPIQVTEYFRKSVDELVSKKTKCVSIHDNITDYNYSTMASGYAKPSPVDLVGYIDGIDWESMDVIIDIDDRYGTIGSPYCIAEEEWHLYQFIIRGRYQIDYKKEENYENTEVASIIQLVGFDLVRIEEERKE